eukprot:GFUD01012210.1.p1 GENE.GFUD01012210.1~~GFUD01012210.1.p1  ORF type:complete len:613 (+),score=159.95 GFUD01012210.1:153-1841(+)
MSDVTKIPESEDPKTARINTGEKRPSSEEAGNEHKKLCSDITETVEAGSEEKNGISSSSPCEVSSTSYQSSNGSSTSTKPITTQEVGSLPVIESVVSEVTEETENTASEIKDNSEKSDENKDKTSEQQNSEQQKEDDIDETTSKLLASGISISLIKKKKPAPPDATKELVKSSPEQKSEEKKTPLEVGPHISVTMVSKQSESLNSGKFTLSLKSPSDLLDPSKSDAKSPNNILLEDLKDTISVSRVNKSPVASTVTTTQGTNSKPPMLSNQQPMMINHQMGFAMQVGPRGIPMMAPNQSPMGMPGLQPRPSGPLMRPNLPLSTGSVSDQLKMVASGLADYMRIGLEDLLRELSSQGSPEATIKGLQLELEKMQWRHNQEVAEMKQNVDMMLKEMKGNIEKENQRTIEQFKKQADIEKQKAIAETKKKQWCANCTKEAIFYCCWNTSYCDYPCQQAHWPSHMGTCSQASNDDDTSGATQEIVPDKKFTSNAGNSMGSIANDQMVGNMNMQQQNMTMAQNMGFSHGMPGMMGIRQPSMGIRAPMGVSIRPGMPGQLTISRPYFM